MSTPAPPAAAPTRFSSGAYAGLLFGGEERCERSARVAPETDRRGGVEAGRLEADRGSDAVEHEPGNEWVRAEGVLRPVEVRGDDGPPSTEGQGDERELQLVAASQCVGRIGGRPQGVDRALIRQQRSDRSREAVAGEPSPWQRPNSQHLARRSIETSRATRQPRSRGGRLGPVRDDPREPRPDGTLRACRAPDRRDRLLGGVTSTSTRDFSRS